MAEFVPITQLRTNLAYNPRMLASTSSQTVPAPGPGEPSAPRVDGAAANTPASYPNPYQFPVGEDEIIHAAVSGPSRMHSHPPDAFAPGKFYSASFVVGSSHTSVNCGLYEPGAASFIAPQQTRTVGPDGLVTMLCTRATTTGSWPLIYVYSGTIEIPVLVRDLLITEVSGFGVEPGPFFDGNTLEYYGDTDADHRNYAWTGTENWSTSIEFNGGFWSNVTPSPAKPFLRGSQPPPVKKSFQDNFDVEISYGSQWISLHDGINYLVAADDFGVKSKQRRRIQAVSPFYDGTYLIHATDENVTEPMNVYVYGESQNDVTENVMFLEELLSQFRFQVRARFGNHRETWFCETADYGIERSHVYLHSTMAIVRAQIPRLPKITQEVIM